MNPKTLSYCQVPASSRAAASRSLIFSLTPEEYELVLDAASGHIEKMSRHCLRVLSAAANVAAAAKFGRHAVIEGGDWYETFIRHLAELFAVVTDDRSGMARALEAPFVAECKADITALVSGQRPAGYAAARRRAVGGVKVPIRNVDDLTIAYVGMAAVSSDQTVSQWCASVLKDAAEMSLSAFKYRGLPPGPEIPDKGTKPYPYLSDIAEFAEAWVSLICTIGAYRVSGPVAEAARDRIVDKLCKVDTPSPGIAAPEVQRTQA